MGKKIHLVYDTVGWAYHRTTSALIKHTPDDLVITHSDGLPENLEEYGLILLLPYYRAKLYRPKIDPYKIKLVYYLNVQFPHHIEYFKEVEPFADYIIYSNQLCYNYAEWPANGCVIPCGTDTNMFYDTFQERRDKALFCSSQIHATHKGVAIANQIPEIEVFVTDSHNRSKNDSQMRNWYNSAKVFICLSKNEGAPRPALEMSACGGIVVSTPVGNMPDLVTDDYNGYLLLNRDIKYIRETLHRAFDKFDRLSANMHHRFYTSWTWSQQAPKFYDLFRSLL